MTTNETKEKKKKMYTALKGTDREEGRCGR
jgi:hypothetical protein